MLDGRATAQAFPGNARGRGGYARPPAAAKVERELPHAPPSRRPPPMPLSSPHSLEQRDAIDAHAVTEHVDEERALVATQADPGVQDGPGAEARADEPWRGYAAMRAADVVDRLAASDDNAVSVALLYERAHRRRRSVLEAAERELERRGASAQRPA
jgi:hypothetical protein